jgi:hypothetical protein
VREWLILRVFCDACDGLGKTIDVGLGSPASPAPFGAGTLGALGAADEPRTLSADSFADAKALCSSGGYSIFAKWIEELTPRAKVADENVEPEPEQADQAAGPRPSPAGKTRRSLSELQEPGALKPALRAVQPLQGVLQPAGQLPAQPTVALQTPEKEPPAKDKSETKAPASAAKDVLRGRRVLSLHVSMCTLSLLERGGQVRVEAAMRVNGTLLRGACAVPDAGSDAWAVWARTDVRVLDEQLTVAYT